MRVQEDKGFLPTVLDLAKARLIKAIGGNGFNIFSSRGTVAQRGIVDRQGSIEDMIRAFRSIVFACIHVRAKEVANKGKFHGAVKKGIEEYEMLPIDHPLNLLLDNPNPYLTPYYFWYLTISFLDTTGNAYSWIAKDKLGIPRVMWPLSPSNVKIVPGNPTAGESIIKGYEVQFSDRPIFVPEEDILHLRHPNPMDPYYYGNSLVMRASYEIDVHDFITKFHRDFFANNAMPSHMVVFPNEMTDETRKAFREQWEEEYKQKPGRVFFAEGSKDVRIEKVTATGDDLAYLESQGVNMKTILAVFGVPPTKLMITENLEARATADSMNYTFHTETIDPLLTMISQQLSVDLSIPFFDPRIYVRHLTTIPTDPSTQADNDTKRLSNGLNTINELRARDGLDPVEGGDEPLISYSLVPLSSVSVLEQIPQADPDPMDEPDPDDEDEDEEEGKRKAGKRKRRRALPMKAISTELSDTQKGILWKAHERYRIRWEIRFGRMMKKAFGEIRDEVLAKIEAMKGMRKDANGENVPTLPASALAFDVEKWISKLRPMVGNQAILLMEDAFKRFAESYSIEGTVFSPNLPQVQSAMEKLNGKTTTIPKNLHADLTAVLDEGIRLQENVSQLAGRVSKFFGDQIDFRSVRIARTVSNYGVNEGNRISAEAGGFSSKIWVTQRDSQVRDLHADLDGEKVGIGDRFSLANGDMLLVPGDPAGKAESVINCRCTAFFTK